jgi:hypothetical protein
MGTKFSRALIDFLAPGFVDRLEGAIQYAITHSLSRWVSKNVSYQTKMIVISFFVASICYLLISLISIALLKKSYRTEFLNLSITNSRTWDVAIFIALLLISLIVLL